MSRRRQKRATYVGQLKRLEFDTQTLVGRESELHQLQSAYNDCSSSHHPQMVGICGYSGVGKTALVETFVREIQHENDKDGKATTTWFSFGKYDQQSSPIPYSAISFALTQLAIEHEHEISAVCKDSVMDKDEIELVVGIVPDLKRYFADEDKRMVSLTQEDSFSRRGTIRSEKIRSALANFIRSLSNYQRFVLCLDDVQWADTASLELIESILVAAEPRTTEEITEGSSNLTLIMIWRSNELESAPALKQVLSSCSPLTIEVGNLTVESLNTILVHALERRLDDSSVMELTKVIHRKTQGNVFFAKEILMRLQRKMLLSFSLLSSQWEWNLSDVIGDTTLSDNAVAIVRDKLRDLPIPLRRAIMVASCIGAFFDKTLLLDLLSANVSETADLTPPLDEPTDFDLLVEMDVLCRREGTERFRFSHDMVQQAAYSLFDSQVHREKTHFAIGQFLLRSPARESALTQLLATDQLNHGASTLRGDVDRLMLMQNNHEAALVAVRKSAFVQAERFHRTAIHLFPKDVLWHEYYGLALTMCSTWVETLLTLGKFGEVKGVVDEVLRNARSPSDTCRVLSVMMNCLHCMNHLTEAYEFGYRHLRKVRKLKLSRKPGQFHAIREFFRSKRLLKKMPIEKLLEVEACNTVDFEYQFLLVNIADNAFLRDDFAFLYFQLKLLNMAFAHGPSKCTAVGLAHYGVFLGATGNIDGAYEVSKWASALEKRFMSSAFHFRVYTVVHCFLSHLRQPQQELMDPMLEMYRSAMRGGDMLLACSCISAYCNMYFFCGLHLNPFIRDIRKHRAVFVEQNGCDSVRCLIDIIGQVALNLTGQSSDPFLIDGEFFQRRNFMDTIVNAQLGVGWICYWGSYLMLSYILDPSSDHVRQSFTKLYLGKKGATNHVDGTTTFSAPPLCTMFCLAAIALERDTGKRVFSKKRKFLTKIVKKFELSGVPGVSHRLFLIEAETLTLNPRASPEDVKAMFDKAISTSNRTGFVQDCAIANERCGSYFLRRDDTEWAEYYLTRAMELYGDWGAMEKAKMMKTQYSVLRGKSHDSASRLSVGLRSRETYESYVADSHRAEVSQILFDSTSSRELGRSVDFTVPS